MTDVDVPLPGGRTTAGVVRRGDTVLRPVGENSGFVHELLLYLEKQRFCGAPQFLGLESSGHEILSFLPGQVPDELGDFSRVQLVAAARLLRSFHDATAGSPLAGSSEVVCHGDASPCNCVFVDGMPTALIDFDAAHPGTRDEDLGYATWLWLDLGNPELAPEFQGQRIAEFFRAYGADPTRAVPAIRSAQSQLAARRQTPSATQLWARQCSQWLEVHSGALSRILVEAW